MKTENWVPFAVRAVFANSNGLLSRKRSPFRSTCRSLHSANVLRDQMVHLERGADDRFRAQAVAAAMCGIIGDQRAERLGDVSAAHDGSSRATSWPRAFKRAAA